MQRDYVILQNNDCNLIMVSIHSNLYPEYLMAGYTVLFNGSKKQCNAYLEGEIEIAA